MADPQLSKFPRDGEAGPLSDKALFAAALDGADFAQGDSVSGNAALLRQDTACGVTNSS